MPIAVNPSPPASTPLRLQIIGAGAPLPATWQIDALEVTLGVGLRASAHLVLTVPAADGRFAASDSAQLAPGATLQIGVGRGTLDDAPLFDGSVLSQDLQIAVDHAPRLVVHCREAQVRDGGVVAGDGTVALTLRFGAELLCLDAVTDSTQGAPEPHIHGHLDCIGTTSAELGARIALVGVGARFSGTVRVAALTHRIAAGAWTTEIRFVPVGLA